MSQITKEDVISFIENMTVLQLSEMVKELESKFGVSAAVAAPVAVAAAGGAAPAENAAEKTEFTVVLENFGSNKLQVIKELRAVVAGLGLKEAKTMVEEAPKTVKEGVSKEEAQEMKTKLEAAGAKVSVK